MSPAFVPGRQDLMQLAAAMSRLGTESAFEVLARATRLQQSGRPVINLGIGQPDFPTPPHIVEAAVKALRDGHHGYTPANGILPLREAVAADMALRRGVEVHPDRVVIVPGGKVTMFFAIAMFGEPGAEILYPDPGFPIYRSLIEWTGATAVPIALHEARGFAFSAEEVLAQITPRTRLIVVNSPANPTGGVVPKGELDHLAAGLARFPEVAVLSDEIYARMCYDGMPHASLTAYPELQDRLILLDGWSKTYAMTGWRLGWGVWPASLAEHAARLAINTHSCVNAAAQWAGIEALSGPQDSVGRMVETFDRRRGIIVDELNRIPGFRCVMPGGAFYAFPSIEGTGRSSRQLQDELLAETDVAIVSGTSFGRFGEGFVRFSYAASTEAIQEACARVRRHIGG
jgi:aspartate aminotransferase